MTDEITWALCPWFEECGEHFIHPDDVDRIRRFNPYGTVVGIGWHHKEEKPTYRLKVAGKIKSKRYWPDDLQRL